MKALFRYCLSLSSFLALCFLLLPAAEAGNRGLIERRVGELDTLNKRVLEQVPERPRDGGILLKAHVHEQVDGNLDVRFYSREYSPGVASPSLDFKGKQYQLNSK